MSFGTTLVVIVAILALMVVKLVHPHGRRDRREPLPPEGVGRGDDPEARRELAELRERIKVLERIATDGHTLDAEETRRISAEIEALREKQAD